MRLKLNDPTPEMIRHAREVAGMTQPQAAEVADLGSPKRWSEYELGARNIDGMRWQMFLLRTDQHPKFTLKAR